ncbi:hypothetical protein [Chryseobacterium caseinilyticum]|uniref:Uncharacterized protein n=1 Tax=Chryseobacterium caseinilyticum TaxID=2771428 RepID=A0ABR8ZG57_9FLAO|nr:hypothetical protein [Chryseobacterium caseinilyticum]MBD8084287.1 hypothetical protein [Chryseobacterium caseinilyticum]
MKINNTNDESINSKFLSVWIKTLSISLLCFFNFHSARNLSDDNVIHVNGGAQIVTENKTENLEQAKIYVTSGATVSEYSENNFEIVKISNAEKRITSKSKTTAKLKHKKAEAEPAKQEVAHKLPKNEETFTSGSESDYAFCAHQHHSTAFAQTQNPVFKHFLKIGFTYLHTYVLDSSKMKIPNGLTHFTGKIYSESYSVRPPPAFS